MRFESRRLDIEVKNYLLSPVQFARFEGKVIDSIEKRESERFLFTNFYSAPPLVKSFVSRFWKRRKLCSEKKEKRVFRISFGFFGEWGEERQSKPFINIPLDSALIFDPDFFPPLRYLSIKAFLRITEKNGMRFSGVTWFGCVKRTN